MKNLEVRRNQEDRKNRINPIRVLLAIDQVQERSLTPARHQLQGDLLLTDQNNRLTTNLVIGFGALYL